MAKRKRKYNQILSCDRTPQGGWEIYIKTPNDQIHHRLYMGYSKSEVLRKVRREDFDRKIVINQPSR